MGKYTDNAINLAKNGLRKKGDNPNRFKKKALVQIGIGIMTAIALAAGFSRIL